MSESSARQRKIIHCDCDCFYAAVEERDDHNLRGRPVAVGGGSDRRGVLCTANYEARKYGVHAAMPTGQAMRLCPDLIVIPPNMDKYKVVAGQVRRVFERYTDLIEPLSLDEAYLDVSESDQFHGSGTLIAQAIREEVRDDIGIAISAGVAPNKFIAKIASDWNKPDGLFVVRPDQVDDFVLSLPVKKIHGVGAVTAKKLTELGLYTCRDVRAYDRLALVQQFGRFGEQLYRYAHGEDDRSVNNSRVRKSVSVESTFNIDISGEEACHKKLQELIPRLEQRLAAMNPKRRVVGQFVKLKTNEFQQTTVDKQVDGGLSVELFTELLQEANSRFNKPIRLLGVGVRFPAIRGDVRQLMLDLKLSEPLELAASNL